VTRFEGFVVTELRRPHRDLCLFQWGFEGFIVSDCDALNDGAFDKYIKDHFNGSRQAQAQQGIRGGTDLNCGSLYGEEIVSAVKTNALAESEVDTALARLFTRSFMLGMHDGNQSSYTQLGPESVDTPAHRALALAAARQALVLLKNTNGALPLRSAEAKRVAIIGPHANATLDLLGNSGYRGDNTLVLLSYPYPLFFFSSCFLFSRSSRTPRWRSSEQGCRLALRSATPRAATSTRLDAVASTRRCRPPRAPTWCCSSSASTARWRTSRSTG
jgi:beta-glucosidase-like glycosyl hydrolase